MRVSGKGAAGLLPRVFSADGPYEHGRMRYGKVMAGEDVIDTGYAVVFYGPHSYTGEDTVELQVHGGSVSTGMVLRAVIDAGARPAEPGEFTRRAFLNGRMDLAQAQAVGELIGALSEAGTELALRQTKDTLHAQLVALGEKMQDIAAHTEAVLEYPDEDIEEDDSAASAAALREVSRTLRDIAATTRAGCTIRDGLRVALAGVPNAGKSSLFNALCDEDVAIVTAVPGTTRDCLRETIQVRGAAVHLVDTAGLRETEDEVEKEGVERSIGAASGSRMLLFVVDSSKALTDEDREAWNRIEDLDVETTVILSKSDLPTVVTEDDVRSFAGDVPVVYVSSVTREGLDDVLSLLYDRTCADELSQETVLLSDLRQRDHLLRAADAADEAAEIFETGMDPDCACIVLRDAHRELGCVTGEYTDEAVIDRIFSKFCLGK